jgi:hypothetical protein
MEEQVKVKTPRTKAAHLICGSKTWTIVAFISCAYFAWVAYGRVKGGGLVWSHDGLDIATHLVWIIFMVGLLTETRCWKERAFFILILVNFGLAFSMGLWKSATQVTVHTTRVISAGAWALAGVASLVLMFQPRADTDLGGPN